MATWDHKQGLTGFHKVFAKIDQRLYPGRLSNDDWKKIEYTEVYTEKEIDQTFQQKETFKTCRREKRWWTVRNKWSKVMFSGESQLWVCENNRVCVWKKAGEVWRPDQATRPNGRKFSVLVWGCLYLNGMHYWNKDFLVYNKSNKISKNEAHLSQPLYQSNY